MQCTKAKKQKEERPDQKGLVDPTGQNVREDPPHHFLSCRPHALLEVLVKREFSPRVKDRLRFENFGITIKEMRGKDIPNSSNLQARESRRTCPIESGVSDLAARAITDSQGYSHKNQEIRKSRQVLVVSGRHAVL